jgi:hypothetical protein
MMNGETMHTLPVTCEACGHTTRLRMTTEQAWRMICGLVRSVAGLNPVELPRDDP